MTKRHQWRALHHVNEELLQVVIDEHPNGTYLVNVCGRIETFRDPLTAMAAADRTFARAFPAHRCGPICRPWLDTDVNRP